MRQAGRPTALHLGAALGAVAVACVVPTLACGLLGVRGRLVVALVLVVAPAVSLALFVWKVARWMRAPVPFRIPVTVGQQRALASIPHSRTGSPCSGAEVVLRVLLDVLLLRPLFRATPTAPSVGAGLGHGMARSLWIIAVVFHLSLAMVVLRHLRLFLEPVPHFVAVLERFDVATEMLLPKLHVSSVLLPLALAFLLGRRLLLPRIRYISLAADYFPLLLLLAIAGSGFVMRHVVRTDVVALKQVTLGLAHGTSLLPSTVDPWLSVHVFLVGLLLAYFPLGKLMHMPGVLMSPTLTMANSNRERRHINVRNPEVATLHYADYEAVFRERMIESGLPIEGAPENAPEAK